MAGERVTDNDGHWPDLKRAPLSAAMTILAAVLWPVPTCGAQANLEQELKHAQSLYQDARFSEAITRLEALTPRLAAAPETTRQPQLSEAHLLLALSYLALNDRASAKRHFVQLLQIDPTRRLDPDVYAPKVIELLEEAKLEVPPSSARPTPAASPDRGKKGSKLPLILLGVAGAGGGIAVVAGGGSRAPASTPPAPSPTPGSTFTRYFGVYSPISWAVVPESPRGCSNVGGSITLSGNQDGSNFMLQLASNPAGAGTILSDGRFQGITGTGGIFAINGQTDGTRISGRMVSTASCIWSFDGSRFGPMSHSAPLEVGAEPGRRGLSHGRPQLGLAGAADTAH